MKEEKSKRKKKDKTKTDSNNQDGKITIKESKIPLLDGIYVDFSDFVVQWNKIVEEVSKKKC